jgi:hypothetical protein
MWGIAAASLATAAASSACCWVPLVAVALGFGAGGAAQVFERYRGELIAASVMLLAVGWYLAEKYANECAPDGTCLPESPRRRTLRRAFFAMCALAVGLFALLPEWLRMLR